MYRSPLISSKLMVLMHPHPKRQVHREAESRDLQGILAPLPPGLPVGRDSLAAGAAELTDPPPPSLWWSISHGRGRFTLEQNEIRAQNIETFPPPGGFSLGKPNGLALCSTAQVVCSCPPHQRRERNWSFSLFSVIVANWGLFSHPFSPGP